MAHFKSDDRFIYVDDAYMEIYIPIFFFDPTKRYATDYSSYIETLGLVYCGLFKDGKRTDIKLMKHPYSITLYVYDSGADVIDLPQPEGMTSCKVLRYTKGAKIMNSETIQDSQNSLQYFDMVMGGKVPKAVPYNQAAESLQKNEDQNHVSFGVRKEVEELVLALSYRDPKNLGRTFAEVWGRDTSVSPFDYATANTRQVCQYASTFAALTFEDFDTMATTSINRSREKKSEKLSPVEEVIKM